MFINKVHSKTSVSNEYRTSDDFKDSNAKPKVVVGVLPYTSKGKILLATGDKFKGKWADETYEDLIASMSFPKNPFSLCIISSSLFKPTARSINLFIESSD